MGERRAGAWALALSTAAVAFVAPACLDRPLCAEDCQPRTTNVFVTDVQANTVDKIDLLFMIDNSSSMADKQKILGQAVPDLVQRLVSPNCVDPNTGQPTTTPMEPSQDCTAPAIREFTPIRDIHIGIITSSLGGHGSTTDCVEGANPSPTEEEKNDHGWLIGTRPRFMTMMPVGGAAPDAKGFLDWNPGTHPVTTMAFNTTFTAMTLAAGEEGCGYESQLESIYRFLVDPRPYASITTQNCPGSNAPCAVQQGIDQTLLDQRKAFLRPDSLVAIIMLTDENDCSIRETKQAFYAAVNTQHLDSGSSVCVTNPNDRCCYSCDSNPPPNCPADPVCAKPKPPDTDEPNLRCFHQKQRFGYDFLYPTERYVNALTQPQICTSRDDLAPDLSNCADADGDKRPDLVDNPLFKTNTAAFRDPSLVFFAGIIGVPWQDIQTTSKPDGTPYSNPAELHYRTAKQLESTGAWDIILGKSNPGGGQAPILPSDALMVESRDPRGGMDFETPPAPLVGTEGGYRANKVNGHEWANPKGDDLQYACIFPLAQPKPCANVSATAGGCDCAPPPTDDVATLKNPLCQKQDGTYSTDQQFAKAYPGLRELEVLKGVGDQAIVASICARNPTDKAMQDYGYRPAVDAIVERLKDKLAGSCIPRALSPDASGKLPCSIVEVQPKASGMSVDCNATPGRKNAESNVVASARLQLHNAGKCDADGKPRCDDLSFCEIEVAGPECHTGETPKAPGWCYIDPAKQKGDNPALVASCPASSRRAIRFVDPDHRTPAPGATALIACFGSQIDDDSVGAGGAVSAP